jgi:osmotically-inducible protein OsmY
MAIQFSTSIKKFMKKIFIHFVLGLALVTGAGLSSCKNKKAADTNTNTPTTVNDSPATAPVEISNDDELKRNVSDATKDYPDVTATVNNGVVTLTGKIKRDRLTTLIQSIQSLHPKQVRNDLTIE